MWQDLLVRIDPLLVNQELTARINRQSQGDASYGHHNVDISLQARAGVGTGGGEEVDREPQVPDPVVAVEVGAQLLGCSVPAKLIAG